LLDKTWRRKKYLHASHVTHEVFIAVQKNLDEGDKDGLISDAHNEEEKERLVAHARDKTTFI
jgi:hypothetical protein